MTLKTKKPVLQFKNLENDRVIYQVLDEMAKNPHITQRELSARLGIALALINAVVKEVCRKGLLKIQGLKPRSITYLLTPRGIQEKSRLALAFIRHSLLFYNKAKKILYTELQQIKSQGINSAVIIGQKDLVEIMSIVANSIGVNILALVITDNLHPKITSWRIDHKEKFFQIPKYIILASASETQASEPLKDVSGYFDKMLMDSDPSAKDHCLREETINDSPNDQRSVMPFDNLDNFLDNKEAFIHWMEIADCAIVIDPTFMNIIRDSNIRPPFEDNHFLNELQKMKKGQQDHHCLNLNYSPYSLVQLMQTKNVYNILV